MSNQERDFTLLKMARQNWDLIPQERQNELLKGWLNESEEEINRLLAENAELKEWITSLNAKECDRLRAENEQLKKHIQDLWRNTAAELGLTAKEGE